jgi:hypothetical protein
MFKTLNEPGFIGFSGMAPNLIAVAVSSNYS